MEPLCDVLEEEYIDRYGEDWTGACVFHIGERGRTEYLDLNIGKMCSKTDISQLTFELAPFIEKFEEKVAVVLTVSDAETGRILNEQTITRDTRMIKTEIDVTGVGTVRVQFEIRQGENDADGLGFIIEKEYLEIWSPDDIQRGVNRK